MHIPEKYKQYFLLIKAGNHLEMKDNRTKIILKTEHDTYRIEVDRGIIQNTTKGIKKSDFAVADEKAGHFALFELKGTVIDKAILQLDQTIRHLDADKDLKPLITNWKRMDACIVSPQRQQIPKDISSKQRNLAKTLHAKSQDKPQNMMSLIHFIKVVPSQKQVSSNTKLRQIVCSNEAPMQLSVLRA